MRGAILFAGTCALATRPLITQFSESLGIPGGSACVADFGNATWQLLKTPLAVSTGWWKVKDIRATQGGASQNYSYYFNLCVRPPPHPPFLPAPLLFPPSPSLPFRRRFSGPPLRVPPPHLSLPPRPPPPSCININYKDWSAIPIAPWTYNSGTPVDWLNVWNCTTTVGGSGDKSNPQYGPGPAFQVANFPVQKEDYCHRLGSQLQSGGYSNVNYKLIDTSNPSRGVGIQYSGGDRCGNPNAAIPTQRSLTVWLQCDEDASGAISENEVVLETPPPAGSPPGSSSCQYEILVKSAYGCPYECPSAPDPLTGGLPQLCSRHGFCDFDSGASKPKCFCNDGWSGTDCGTRTSAASSGLSGTGGVLLAVCIFLVGTLAFLGFLWYRIRSLRLDPAAYSALRAGPELAASGGGSLQE
jgi:hypothetical protein